MKIEYSIPPTRDLGSCIIVGKESPMESARDNALWEYNSMRAHDGLPPISSLPWGTTSKRLPNETNER